jgi:hypothetical protein
VKGISYAQLVIIFTSNVGERALLDTLVKNKSRRLSIKLQDQLSEKLEDATQTGAMPPICSQLARRPQPAQIAALTVSPTTLPLAVKSPKKQGFVGANFIVRQSNPLALVAPPCAVNSSG